MKSVRVTWKSQEASKKARISGLEFIILIYPIYKQVNQKKNLASWDPVDVFQLPPVDITCMISSTEAHAAHFIMLVDFAGFFLFQAASF